MLVSEPKHVALLCPMGWEGMEELRRGVETYAREHAEWVIAALPETARGDIRTLRGWKGDGAITNIRRQAELRALQGLDIPVVNASGVLGEGATSRVLVDNRAIGQLAAEHLLDCGFRRFAFYGRRGAYDVRQREHGFRTRVQESGCTCASFYAPSLFARWAAWERNLTRSDAFFRELEAPFGVMACDDMRARMALDSCRRVGLQVPDEVGIIGVDNLVLTCEFCDPPLSSVDRGMKQLGFEAAALLDRLMAGEPAPDHDLLIPPVGVVRRRSTDVMAVEDQRVRHAVDYVREHYAEPFGVERLVSVVSVSRRWLEHSFKRELGCTIHQYLCRVRVQHAKELLAAQSDMLLKEVAWACGFTSPKRFRIVFERLTGQTPSAYRTACRKQGAPPAPEA
jgi:LacI family transcriptional regulator